MRYDYVGANLGLDFLSRRVCFMKLGAPVFGVHVFRVVGSSWHITPLIRRKSDWLWFEFCFVAC